MTVFSAIALRRPGSPAADFRPPAGGRVTFLCLPTHAQERVRTAKPARRAEGRMPGVKKSNQKKEHPALAGLIARQVREGRPGFSTGLLPRRKGIDIPVDPPAGLIVQPSPPHRGPTRPKPELTARAAQSAAHRFVLFVLRFGWLLWLWPWVLTFGSPLARWAGGGKARRVAGRDAGQFGVRAGCPVVKPP